MLTENIEGWDSVWICLDHMPILIPITIAKTAKCSEGMVGYFLFMPVVRRQDQTTRAF